MQIEIKLHLKNHLVTITIKNIKITIIIKHYFKLFEIFVSLECVAKLRLQLVKPVNVLCFIEFEGYV